jgi:PAS domain S-box-containing protein
MDFEDKSQKALIQLERLQAECEQAKELFREYEKLFEETDDMIASVDRDYRFCLANHAYCDRRAMQKEEVIGRPVTEVLGQEIFEGIVKGMLHRAFLGETVIYEMKPPIPGWERGSCGSTTSP